MTAEAATAEAALALLSRGDPGGALAALEPTRDVAADPAYFTASGMALLARQRFAEALAALRTAIALGDASPPTLLNLAIAEDRGGDHQRARKLIRQVAAHLPEWDEPPLRLAESLRATNEREAAEAAYRQVLSLNPARTEALIALSGLLIGRAEMTEARDLLLRCCTLTPDNAEAWDTLGLALLGTEEADAALSAFIEAQRLAPDRLDYALHGVDAACVAGARAQELARLDAAAELDPLNPAWHTARGTLLARLGDPQAAVDALEVATALAPDAPVPVTLLASVLVQCDRLKEAEAALRRALELCPDNHRIGNDLGAVLMRMTRHAEARLLLSEVVGTWGESVHALSNLANATVCVGLQTEAVALARRTVELDPGSVLAWRTLCNTLPYLDGIDGTTLLTALKECGARVARADMPAPANSPDPDRPLVIGLLSGSLKSHPVGWLTVAGFESLDPTRFSLVCLAQNSKIGDPIAQRFRCVARTWIDVDPVDDVKLAHMARDAGIDILIDLGGYGEAGRMEACVNRLAPVQIKWVGMQNHSSGLPEMDWIITDRWETPPTHAPFYSERLLVLPDGYICYSPPPYAPDAVPLPALRNGHVTFGCFNNMAKITPVVIETWAEILRVLPDARMVLKTHQFSDAGTQARIRSAFATHGIAAERLELRGASGHRAFLREYNDIDIVLDPFPYSGGLTTCEALWMGVPTLTMPGETFASRHSLSHLSNVGLTDWVASGVADYVALAVAKASDLPGLAVLRGGLRARTKSSPLCDAPRFGRNLGAALRSAWRDWCSRQ
jgi:predicted O-linked N-acetylglucosamine transferase (SPINDLY family)